MILKIDIGIDELSENLYQIAVMDHITHEVFCHVFGKTPEECDKRANDLIYAYNTSEVTT